MTEENDIQKPSREAVEPASAGSLFDAPTTPGWWWVREATGEWYGDPVHVLRRGKKLVVAFSDGGYEPLKQVTESGWTKWAGPLLPPASQNT